MNNFDPTKPVQTRSGVPARMTTTEHLQRIRAKCVELLALAEKRTPGEWQENKSEGNSGLHFVKCAALGCVADRCYNQDATFIAACAGAAEAGWRSTIAAIDGLERYENFEAMFGHTCPELDTILVAWPEELL